MQIKDSVVLITGANRGLGLAFAEALLARGARKVYAAAREPASVTLAGVVPVRLDVTDAGAAEALAARLGDVTLLINNAGIARRVGFLADDTEAAMRAEFEVNVYGPLHLARAFAPVLRANGGGAIINVLSVLSWINVPDSATYAASKAAAWSVTNGLRHHLREQRTQVLALHMAHMDTDMARHIDAPKTSTASVAAQALDGLEAGRLEVHADDLTRQVKSGLSAAHAPYLGKAEG